MAIRNRAPSSLYQQNGVALMVMLVILIMGTLEFLVSSLNSSALQIERDGTTTAALAQAKDALIGDAATQTALNSTGYLRLPDLGFGMGSIPAEGSSPPNFSGNSADYAVIGKVPWKILGISPARDGQGECLWVIVSGRFKNNPKTNSAMNWDTPGQIDVIDGNGNSIASNLAALLVAPGPPLAEQNRTQSDPAYTQCGGNYDARNYLDPVNVTDSVSGEINYFSGSTHNRIAANTNNKRFVMAKNDHYNDRFLFISVEDIFRPIIRRSDFPIQISALMNDTYFQSVAISGSKGIDNVSCNALASNNQTFCSNWKEMLLLKRTSGACSRVLIFGGHKNASQVRLTTTDKANPANYLEGANLTAFVAANPAANNFSGLAVFNANDPNAELIRCIP